MDVIPLKCPAATHDDAIRFVRENMGKVTRNYMRKDVWKTCLLDFCDWMKYAKCSTRFRKRMKEGSLKKDMGNRIVLDLRYNWKRQKSCLDMTKMNIRA
jgi:hypothetical protein